MGLRVTSFVLGALVVASVAAVDPSGLAPFGPAKWWAISTLGWLGGGLALLYGRQRVHRATLLLWLALLLLLTVGAFTGGDLPTSLLGQPDRHLGLVTWLLFLALYCAGQQLADASLQSTISRAAVVAAAWLGVWALWELVFGPPIGLDSNTDRLTGPFGSAAFLGAAVCLVVPVAAGVAFDRTADARWRVAAAVSCVLGGIALVGSGARAGWLAAAITSLIVVLRRRPSLAIIGIGALVLGIAVAAAAPRLDDVLDRTGGGVSRLDEWSVAATVVGAHPLVGVGPEGYRIAVSEGVDRAYERAHGRDRVLPDRAHSGPIDVALAGGVAAALAYCALVAFVCWRAFGLLRGRGPQLAGIAAGVIAYALQQLLLFPLAELDPVWWLLAGIVVSTGGGTTWTRRPDARRFVLSAAALAIALVAFVAGLLDVAADRLARDAIEATDAPPAIRAAERAVRLRPDNIRYRMVAAQALAGRGTLADIDAALAQTERALDWSAHDPIAADQRASLLLERAGITGAADDAAAALDAWQALVARDPVRARWQLQFGRAAALAGDTDTARGAWTTAADLSPDDPTAAGLLAALGPG